MPTVGSQQTFVSGVRAQLTLNGNLYAAATTFNFKTGNKLEQEKVIGTDIRIVNTAEFDGSGEMTILWSTENTGSNEQFTNLLIPTAGSITPIGFQITGKDVQNNQRAFTWTGTLWVQDATYTITGVSAVVAKVSFIFNARPTLT
jgi:hypothetical protein